MYQIPKAKGHEIEPLTLQRNYKTRLCDISPL